MAFHALQSVTRDLNKNRYFGTVRTIILVRFDPGIKDNFNPDEIEDETDSNESGSKPEPVAWSTSRELASILGRWRTNHPDLTIECLTELCSSKRTDGLLVVTRTKKKRY